MERGSARARVPAAPVSTSRVGLVHGNQNWITILHAVTPESLGVRDWDIDVDRAIDREESAGAAKVVVRGETVTEKLFGETDRSDKPSGSRTSRSR